MQPWGANRTWPLALLVLLAAELVTVAAWLEARRDLGAGLMPERPGPAGAPARYATPLGLAVRLQRGPIIGWSLTVVLCALLFGSVVESMTNLLNDAGSMPAMLGGTGVDALLSLLVVMIAMVTAVFALQLAGALSRSRWALQRLLIPAVPTAVLLFVGGAGMGAGYGSIIGDPGQASRLAVVALAYWPAVMALVGVAVALFGWLPRLAIPLTWGVLAAMWFIVIIGDALHLPGWLLELLTPAPLIVMTLVAAALVWSGLDRFARRDVQPG